MSQILLDYNPLTGVSEFMQFDSADSKVRILQVQDVSNIVRFTKEAANTDSDSIKSEHCLYARIPAIIEAEMKSKHGVWWEDKNDHEHRKFFSVLNEHYPAFKTTAWNHE